MPLRRDALRGFHGLRPWPVEKLFQYSGSPCETCLVHKTLTGGEQHRPLRRVTVIQKNSTHIYTDN